MGFWATVGIRSETPGMGDQFAMRGWTGTEIAIGHRRGSGPDADLGDLGAIAPGLGIALLAVHLTEPMRKPIDWTRLIVPLVPSLEATRGPSCGVSPGITRFGVRA